MDTCTHHGAAGIRIRPLVDGERRAVEEVFAGLSERSRFLRFHTGTPRLTERHVRHLSTVRPGVHEACVAETGGVAVGIARWHRLRDEAGTAELAVAVVDAHHGLGLGRRLVAATLRSARAAGIEHLTMEIHPENAVARRWLAAAGSAPSGPWGSTRVRVAEAMEMVGRPSEACGCMSRWSTGSSDRSGPAPAGSSHSPGAIAPVTCSPSSSSVAGAPSRPRPSSTSSGELVGAS